MAGAPLALILALVRRTLAILIGLTLVGCGKLPQQQPHFSCNAPQDGIVLISWTVRGAAPSSTSCAGIDHLVVEFDTQACGGGSIEPVPCDLTKWRYDDLPRGPAQILVTAVDANGNATLQGGVNVILEPSVPPTPSTLNLN